MHYLDTSTVRKLGRKLDSPTYRDKCYTSVITLIELLNGVRKDERSYRNRKSHVDTLALSRIPVRWTFPEIILIQAFQAAKRDFDIEELRLKSLRTLLRLLRQSKSQEEFIEEQSSLSLEYPLDYFETYDDEIGKDFIREAIQGQEDFKNAHASYSEQGFPSLAVTLEYESTKKLTQQLNGSHIEINCGLSIYALSQWVLGQYKVQLSESERENKHKEIFQSYNNSIDLFVAVFSRLNIENVIGGNRPGRNDFLDLLHLLYLTVNAYLITDDCRARKRAELAGIKVMSSDELAFKCHDSE